MDVVGSEIGQKMRSAIKAKLTELGCYVDDELPDYVMVMVANKRTRLQMEDDLQLFLGDNTELFVNWLHQVLKKLQEVTVTPLKAAVVEAEKPKEKTKEKKSKDNKKVKTKLKKADSKKSKKKDKDKEKSLKKKEKEEKKAHKSKKKSKHHEMIRPNVPPLLMNIEKESEPSITDVFAGQILKSHGITIDITKEEKQVDVKPVIIETKRPILPIIDPQTIQSQPDPDENESQEKRASVSSVGAPRNDQIKEMNDIEAKIQGLKQKLAEQLDSMSEDEDFLNIRTEAEELMNDFAEDVFQEISSQAPVATPPIPKKTPVTPPPAVEASETPKEPPPAPIVPKEPETLPQIELNLPKRPIRERLGAREEAKKAQEVTEKVELNESPERFTPDREPLVPKAQSARSRLGEPAPAAEEKAPSLDLPNKRLTSKVSSFCRDSSSQPIRASVVRVRPRPRRAQPAPALLLRAVADAHKSLLDQPAKPECGAGVQRALVRPMRRDRDREREKHHIVIEVPQRIDADVGDKSAMETEKDGYVSSGLTKVIHNTEYMPSRRPERTSCRRDDTLIIETINIHNPTVGKDKDTQFIVTMDGFNPNAFLAKKLMTEGLLDDGAEIKDKSTNSVLKTASHTTKSQEVLSTVDATDKIDTKTKSLEKHDVAETSPKRDKRKDSDTDKSDSHENIKISSVQTKRLSNTSEDSETQVIINKEETKAEKRKGLEVTRLDSLEDNPAKKRKASPIVFDVSKKEKKEVENESERKRTESASSETQVTVTTVTNSHKYDSVPPLSSTSSTTDRAPWCRSFPLCRFGAACAFQHPACKFAAACTRRGCVYAHVRPPAKGVVAPVLASHVVPAAGFKSINTNALPSVCKFYPNCVNPACHFYHPKPCRYGKACINKLECNFYHNDTPKWRYPV